jgi:hypothetical protein
MNIRSPSKLVISRLNILLEKSRPGKIPFKQRFNRRSNSPSSTLGRIGYPSGEHTCPKIVFPREMVYYIAKSLKL